MVTHRIVVLVDLPPKNNADQVRILTGYLTQERGRLDALLQKRHRRDRSERRPFFNQEQVEMLEVECEKCRKRYWVKGFTTPDGWTDPGEVVTELECEDELCQCLQDGEAFSVTDESHPTFDDDVI